MARIFTQVDDGKNRDRVSFCNLSIEKRAGKKNQNENSRSCRVVYSSESFPKSRCARNERLTQLLNLVTKLLGRFIAQPTFLSQTLRDDSLQARAQLLV